MLAVKNEQQEQLRCSFWNLCHQKLIANKLPRLQRRKRTLYIHIYVWITVPKTFKIPLVSFIKQRKLDSVWAFSKISKDRPKQIINHNPEKYSIHYKKDLTLLKNVPMVSCPKPVAHIKTAKVVNGIRLQGR